MQTPEGFLLVNKPVGLPSFQVVRKIRYLTKVSRVGFAGTLDPFAGGLLVVGIGRKFTRRMQEIQDLPKKYDVTMVLGLETDTLDSFGKITSVGGTGDLDNVQNVLEGFVGTFDQMPPQFSAKKVDGKRAYKMARSGESVELRPASVSVYSMSLETLSRHTHPQIRFSVKCSKGTYVRSLVRDIGTAMGSCAYTKNLVREEIGQFSYHNALAYRDLNTETIQQHIFYD